MRHLLSRSFGLAREAGWNIYGVGAFMGLLPRRYRYFKIDPALDAPENPVIILHPDFGGACDLTCSFCFEKGWRSGAGGDWPLDHGDRITAELGMILAEVDAPRVTLRSQDIVQYGPLEELLSCCSAHGKQVHLRTPGHGLADRATFARLARPGVTFELTYFSSDPRTSARMSGRETMLAELDAALTNITRAGAELRLSIVLTRDNIQDLPQTVQHLEARFGITELALCLYGTRDDGRWSPRRPIGGLDQHPGLADVNRALAHLQRTLSPGCRHRLVLQGFPPCQLTGAIADNRVYELVLVGPAIRSGRSLPQDCLRCTQRAVCESIDRYYPRHLSRRPLDAYRAEVISSRLAESRRQISLRHEQLSLVRQHSQPGDCLVVERQGSPEVGVGIYSAECVQTVSADGEGWAPVRLDQFLRRSTRVVVLRGWRRGRKRGDGLGALRRLGAEVRGAPLDQGQLQSHGHIVADLRYGP